MDYQEFAERISTEHPHLFGENSRFGYHQITDFYEAWEDVNRLQPVFDRIISKTLTNEELTRELTRLGAWLWHTIGHLTVIKDLLEREE